MYSEIASGIAGIKTLSDLIGLALKLKVDSAVTEKAIESQSAIVSLQSAILSIQAQNQELLEERNRLKQKLIDMEKWEEEAQKYALTEVGGSGCLAYALKMEHTGSAPTHWLCPSCYEEKRKSIFQLTGTKMGRNLYSCARCPAQVIS